MFSWLGELVAVFQLIELDLISLKGTTVSNSRFWGVCGFSVSLSSPPGIGSVRHIYFCSHVKVTVSVYLHCHHSPACPWNLCQCSCPLVLPCTASQRLLGRDLCGSFLSSLALPSASWRPVWASLSPSACLLCGGACVHLLGLTGPALYIVGLVSLVSAPQACPLCYGACVHMFLFSAPALCTARFVCSEFHVWIPRISWHPGWPLHLGLLVDFPWFPEPAVWLGPQSMSCLWAEKCNFLFSALQVLCFDRDPLLPLGPPCEGASQCSGISSSFTTPSLGAQTPV